MSGGWTCGVLWQDGASQTPYEMSHMSDKSPRQGMTKKTAKSIKEKRAEKHSKASGSSIAAETPVKKK